MNTDLNLFVHTAIDNHVQKTLFLLHGTGGDETDLLFLDGLLEKSYNLVGLRGNVNENGMNRFFVRSAPGVFDQESIRAEADKLYRFVSAWGNSQNHASKDMAFVGYSNGANVALATLFYYPQVVYTCALLHPMLPFEPEPSLTLLHLTMFISSGEADPMVPSADTARLMRTLSKTKATITHRTYPGGHEISETEIADVVLFLKKLAIER